MPRRPRFAFKPAILGLETRDVPTVISPLAFHGAGLRAQRIDALANAKLDRLATPFGMSGGQAGVGNSGPVAGVSASAGGLPGNLSFSPNPEINPAMLTRMGRSAAYFTAKVTGPYALSRSFYSDVAKQIVYIGNIGGTPGQILHGTTLMNVVVPSTPGAATYGIAVIRDLSNGSTGLQLVLDLTETAHDGLGRPTQFTWNVDSTSGGTYANAPGQGMLSIAYHANGHSRDSAGGYTAIFRGAVLPDPTRLNTAYDVPQFN